MTILFHSASGSALLIRILLISTTVVSAAVMLKIFESPITDFLVRDLPSTWNAVVSWLRPPYLYLVINCIIITIAATSKLQVTTDDDEMPTPPLDTPVEVHSVTPRTKEIQTPAVDFPGINRHYDDFILDNQAPVVLPEVSAANRNSVYPDTVESPPYGHINSVVQQRVEACNVPEDEVDGDEKEDEFIISRSPWMPLSRQDSSGYGELAEKPLASSRFSHRKNANKSAPDGGKSPLAVSKPKRQDTLESTWKMITEGWGMPLTTRHLRKSDTYGSQNPLRPTSPQKKMTKSETFNNDRSPGNGDVCKSSPSPRSKSGKLKREPSLGQDELTRRVEAFIKKFNEEMRLERQESLIQYKKMINGRGH
ncbi:unnamed protein product [Cuscuta epithymum]|uniref:DUF4408 domain-containing protein n=1 Tax=Cuscuta epithymum TaxID=186058 RepID=A0AAV0DRP1_9ASTE|nr:unnamed protein product [Cuscuta epithymum]